MIKKITLTIGSLALASLSCATFTQVGSAAAMGANDGINWSQFGGDNTMISSGTHGTTNNGIGFTLYSQDGFGNDDGGTYELRTEGTSWGGVFNVGDTVLWHHNSGNGGASVMAIYFDTHIAGAGSDVTSNAYGDFDGFSGYWDSYPSTSLGFPSVHGTMGFGPNGTAPFMGGLTDANDLGQVFLSTAMSDGSDDQGFAVNNFSIRDGAAVPEPASMAALGLGIAALIRKRKNSR